MVKSFASTVVLHEDREADSSREERDSEEFLTPFRGRMGFGVTGFGDSKQIPHEQETRDDTVGGFVGRERGEEWRDLEVCRGETTAQED